MIEIINGDCLEVLKTLPDQSVNCCVTSPPYWGLRCYGVDGQLGLEKTPEEYVSKMVEIFSEVRRCLRDDGTLWLNLGDSYSSGDRSNYHSDKLQFGKQTRTPATFRPGTPQGLKPKDLCGIPWRVAFALQADGWYLRQDIIWAKPNPMPESVRDRCTKAHEYIFLLSKSGRYYYDAKAIKEPCVSDHDAGNGFDGRQGGAAHLPMSGGLGTKEPWTRNKYKTPDGWDTSTGKGGHGSFHKDGREKGSSAYVPKSHKGSRFDTGKTAQHQLNRSQIGERVHGNLPGRDDGGAACNKPGQEMRNKRSVWTVATKPYKDAHFATFPPKLIEPCILAGCPEGGTVLDPFAGSGTTGEVAQKLGRKVILIELNPEYISLAKIRTAQTGLPL